MLLKEIYHRVKNNLMIISSLLSLQSRYIKDEESKIFSKKARTVQDPWHLFMNDIPMNRSKKN